MTTVTVLRDWCSQLLFDNLSVLWWGLNPLLYLKAHGLVIIEKRERDGTRNDDPYCK